MKKTYIHEKLPSFVKNQKPLLVWGKSIFEKATVIM